MLNPFTVKREKILIHNPSERLIIKKIKEYEKAKENEQYFNCLSVFLLNSILAFIYYVFLRTSYINEKISIHNTPSFPLYNFSVNLNFDSFKENINIFCTVFLYLKNGTIITAKENNWYQNKDENYFYNVYSQPLKFLDNDPNLKKEEYLCIVVFCNERDSTKLYGKSFTLNYSTYIINSNDEIEEKKEHKIFILDEELILNANINEGKVYNYKIESNIIKKGDITKNFSSISEYEKLRFVPPEKYGSALFTVILEKGDILKILEVEKQSFFDIFSTYFGTMGILVNMIFLLCYKRKYS